MQIDGPFTVNIIENSDSQTRELHLGFTPQYRALELNVQLKQYKDYIVQLQDDILKTNDDANRQGMLTIQQIAEQLLPHLEAGEIPLDETIIIEMGPTSPFDNLLSGATLK